MSKIITLRKGLDINLQGKAVEKLVKLPLAPEYAVSPLDFEGGFHLARQRYGFGDQSR